MKQGTTLTELAARLESQIATKRDFVADTRNVELVDGGETLVIDNAGEDGGLGAFRVSDHTHGQIAARLKIPRVYYDRMRRDAPSLLDQNVNEWFRTQPERRMVRTMEGNARAFVSDRYRRLDNYDLATAVLPILNEIPDASIHSCELTETRMYLKVLAPRVTAEVKVGDVVQAGVVISNSEIGAGALSVSPLVFRLVCLNGMIAADYGQRRTHVGRHADDTEAAYEMFRDETLEADDRALYMKVQDVVRASVTQTTFDQIVAGLRDLADITLPNPLRAVEQLANRLTLTDDEQGSVLRHLIDGGDLSAWGAVNAVTRASQDVVSYDRATELERAGGQLAELPAADWAVIGA